MINQVERITLTVRFKTSMVRSSLCDYSDAYILVSATITVPNTGTAANPNISEINSTEIDNAKNIRIVMLI